MKTRALVLLCVVAAASPAGAGTIELVPTCITVDETKDTLGPLERTQAMTMLRHVLEEQDLLVVDSGCADTYTLFHLHDGDAMIVHVRGPGGGRKLRVAGMADLPGAYERMVTSLRAPAAPVMPDPPAPAMPSSTPAEAAAAAPPSAADVEDRASTPPSDTVSEPETAAADQPLPRRHNFLYAQLGIGAMGGTDGPHSFAAGYRHEGAGTVFDGAYAGFSSGAGTQEVDGSRATAKILHLLTPNRGASAYVGGGLGVSGSTIQLQSSAYSGSGLEGIGTVGLDLLRDHPSMRMFVQADVILPFYTMHSNMTDETEYAGTVMLSFGLGFAAGR